MGARESLNGRKNVARRKVKNGEKSSSRRSLLFFVPYIFFRPFRLSLAPFICPWVSEDAFVFTISAVVVDYRPMFPFSQRNRRSRSSLFPVNRRPSKVGTIYVPIHEVSSFLDSTPPCQAGVDRRLSSPLHWKVWRQMCRSEGTSYFLHDLLVVLQ